MTSYKKKAIIVDIDGTLTDSSHREFLVTGGSKDWNQFFDLCDKDSVNEWCASLVFGMKQSLGVSVIYLTGRPERLRSKTLDWFETHGIDKPDALFMRPDGDFRQDTIFKSSVYREHIEPFYNVLFALDDKPSIVRMWKGFGITGLYCGKKNVFELSDLQEKSSLEETACI